MKELCRQLDRYEVSLAMFHEKAQQLKLKAQLREIAEALYFIGFEAKPETVNYQRCRELYYELEGFLGDAVER